MLLFSKALAAFSQLKFVLLICAILKGRTGTGSYLSQNTVAEIVKPGKV
jgi:hypothetical protein